MKRELLFAACCCVVSAVVGQQYQPQGYKDSRTKGMNPEMTELYAPQPPRVTPGDIQRNTAPSDAIVLFDGSNLDAWRSDRGDAGWKINKDGTMTVVKSAGDIITRESFGDFQLHIEWMSPKDIHGSGQGRGNSGVYLQDRYEVQVLDSYDNETYVNGQAASIYKQSAPLVNPCRKPGEWNVYDIIYTAPIFNEDGTYLYKPRVTVLHNGVLVQNNTEIIGTTEYIGFPKVKKHGDGPILLQSHGDPSPAICYRNIWIRRL